MKLKQFLEEAYKQQPLVDDMEQTIEHAYKHLTYEGSKNKELLTKGVLLYGEERERALTGEEILAKGIYLLYSEGHTEAEILVEQDDYKSALVKQKEWNAIGFNPYDYCSLVIVH